MLLRAAAVVVLLSSCSDPLEIPMGCGTWTLKSDPTVQINKCAPKYNAQLDVDGNIRASVLYTYQWAECDQCQ
jgi:hypothetical protein